MGDGDERALYEHAACGLLTTLANGLIVRANQRFCEWVGYSCEQLVGVRRVQDLLTVGCKIFHQTHWMPLMQMQGSVAEVQLELMHREGHVIPVLVNALQRKDGTGAVHHDLAVFVAADRRKYERELLYARKRAEELLERERRAQAALALAEAHLRLALDSARLLIWGVDVATRTPTFEPGVHRLLRLPDDVPLTAELYASCIHPDDREREQSALEAALAPLGDGLYNAEYRLLTRAGDEVIIHSMGRAFFDESRQLVGFSGVLEDVTGWRRAEAALREQEQAATQRAVIAEQLIGIVSHDLRTPINAVLLGANLLAANGVNEAQQRTVKRISSAATRANGLITDLLDFTQARLGGGIRVKPQDVDLHDLVRECLEELKLAWPGRMIDHRAEGPGELKADPDRLAQVLTNLVTNALTYGTAERPVCVTSRVGDETASIEVHNGGLPIAAELLAHVFEPLRRGEQQVRLGSRSVGLGLYIVQQIARSHRGEVSVRSTAEEGTTFTVLLPRRGA